MCRWSATPRAAPVLHLPHPGHHRAPGHDRGAGLGPRRAAHEPAALRRPGGAQHRHHLRHRPAGLHHVPQPGGRAAARLHARVVAGHPVHRGRAPRRPGRAQRGLPPAGPRARRSPSLSEVRVTTDRRRVAPRRDRRHQPPQRPGRERHRRQRPRRHRAGRGGQPAGVAGVPRLAHRPPQPGPAQRPARPRGRPGPPRRRPDRAALLGPRPVQAGQRLAWATRPATSSWSRSASASSGVVRAGDTVARLGGDEFVVAGRVGERDRRGHRPRRAHRQRWSPRRSSCRRAWSRSRHRSASPTTAAAAPSTCSATPTPRSTGPRRRAGTASTSSPSRCGPRRCGAWPPSRSCATRSTTSGSRCTTSRSSTWPPVRSRRPRPCSASGATTAAWSCPASTSTWPTSRPHRPGRCRGARRRLRHARQLARAASATRRRARWRSTCRPASWASAGFTDRVRAAPRCARAGPADLVLEFTEATVIGADRATLRAVQWLHKLGVGLSIDDFGTGYSSLAYLKRFPIQSVKLDRTFVAGLGVDPSDAEIVRAVVSPRPVARPRGDRRGDRDARPAAPRSRSSAATSVRASCSGTPCRPRTCAPTARRPRR